MSKIFVNEIAPTGSALKMPAGHVVQTVTARPTADLAVTTSGSMVDITMSQCSITSKLANSSFLYKASVSSEGDASSAYNNFIRMVYTVNGGSTVVHDSTKLLAGTAVLDSMGTVNLGINYLFDGITSSAGTTFVFFFQYQQNTTSSFHFNQSSLSGQPGSTSQMTSVIVQEIAG